MNYPVAEIFRSLQGEGRWTGREAVFVRLAGCNLKCLWCDTAHSKARMMSGADIAKAIRRYWRPTASIIITGGEPTIHDLRWLLDAVGEGYWIGLETNGTNDLTSYAGRLSHISFSPKRDKGRWIATHDSMIGLATEIRVVNDGIEPPMLDWLCGYAAKHRYLSPLWTRGKMNLMQTVKLLASTNERSAQAWNLSIQTHKLLAIR
jgi:organic radical activating enzyme